jgi:adenylate cyclase
LEGNLLRGGYAQHITETPDFEAICHKLEAFQRGNVGWANWLGEFHLVELDDRFPWRFTLVLMLEAGIWKIVQAHSSTPRMNIEIARREVNVFQRLMEAAKTESDVLGVEGTTTIMFTDIANSTSIAAFAGDRVWSDVIGQHLAKVRTIVEANDGSVVKTLGDGTMSSFVSAWAAMQPAVGIQRAIANNEADPPLQVRIGMHACRRCRKSGWRLFRFGCQQGCTDRGNCRAGFNTYFRDYESDDGGRSRSSHSDTAVSSVTRDRR